MGGYAEGSCRYIKRGPWTSPSAGPCTYQVDRGEGLFYLPLPVAVLGPVQALALWTGIMQALPDQLPYPDTG